VLYVADEEADGVGQDTSDLECAKSSSNVIIQTFTYLQRLQK